MQSRWRQAVFAQAVLAAMLAGAGLSSVTAAERPDCRQRSISELKARSSDGYAIYSRIADKKFFLSWITCDDIQLGLASAVHESVHHLAEDHDAFPLLRGATVQRPHEVSKFFAPSVLAARFDRDDGFAETYLKPGHSSSASDFLYLLDELNAYSHDLNAAVALNSLHPVDQQVDHRDGLAALMAFVAAYVETAERKYPATWAGLQQPAVAGTVSALWGQAETVMTASCGIPDFGTRDKSYIRRFCQPQMRASLARIIGRAPACPTQCLTSRQALGEADKTSR